MQENWLVPRPIVSCRNQHFPFLIKIEIAFIQVQLICLLSNLYVNKWQGMIMTIAVDAYLVLDNSCFRTKQVMLEREEILVIHCIHVMGRMFTLSGESNSSKVQVCTGHGIFVLFKWHLVGYFALIWHCTSRLQCHTLMPPVSWYKKRKWNRKVSFISFWLTQQSGQLLEITMNGYL